MSTIRKRGEKWQSIIRISGHPDIAKSFVSKTDAKRWATLTETMKIAGHSDPRMLLRIYNNLEAHHVAKKLN